MVGGILSSCPLQAGVSNSEAFQCVWKSKSVRLVREADFGATVTTGLGIKSLGLSYLKD